MLRRAFRLKVFLLAGIASAGISLAQAAEAAFSERLSDDEQEATGVARLSDEQREVLDNLVEREVRLARQGNVPAFAGEFTNRRSAPELAKAGIDSLSKTERTRLNAKVAQAIATRPIELNELTPVPNHIAARGIAPKPIVHGEVSFTYGVASGGRSFYGGSFYVEQTDPVKGYTIGIGVSQYKGDGLFFMNNYDCYFRWGRPLHWFGRY